jgi:hypothetical protein
MISLYLQKCAQQSKIFFEFFPLWICTLSDVRVYYLAEDAANTGGLRALEEGCSADNPFASLFFFCADYRT